MDEAQDALSSYAKSRNGEMVKVRLRDAGLETKQVERMVARFDANTGERLEDAIYVTDLADLERQRAAHQTEVERLDEEIAAVKAAIEAEDKVEVIGEVIRGK